MNTINTRLDLITERWAQLGIIAFISSFIWSPSRDGLDGSYVLFFLFPVIFLIFRRKIPIFASHDIHFLAILLFCSYATISSLWNTPKDIYFFLAQLFVFITWFSGSTWLTTTNKINFSLLFHTLIYIGSAVSLATVIIFYTQTTYQDGYHLEIRLTCWCSAENSNLIGSLFGVLTLICYVYYLSHKTKIEAIKYGFICSILALPLLFSQSRAALLAFMIAAIVALFIIKPKSPTILIQFMIALPGLFFFLKYSDLQAIWADRAPSMGLRDIVWEQAFKQIAENFIFGIGLSQNTKIFASYFGYYNHAHNAWLDTLLRTGIIGLLLTTFITYLIFKKAYLTKTIEGKIFFVWFLFGVTVLTFDHRLLFWQIDTKWFFYWIPAPFIIALYNKQKALNNL